MKNIYQYLRKRSATIVIVTYLLLFNLFTLFNKEEISDWAIYFRFFITLSCFMVFLFYLIYKQFKEVIRPASWLTGLRILLLGILILITVTLIPSLFNQYYQSVGETYQLIRDTSVVVGAFNLAALTIFFVLVYNYKGKDE